MATTRPIFGDLFDMPAGLRKFVLSKEFDEADATLQKTYSLPDDKTIAMGDAIMSAINNGEELSKTVAAIKAMLVPAVVPEAQWKDFLSDMLKLEIWPLRELFGSELTSILNDEQIGTSSWPQFHVLLRPLTYSGAASEVASMAGISLMEPHTRERLRDLVMSRAKGVRIDPQVREVLVRPVDFGGLGLDQQKADQTLVAMNQLISQVQIMSEEEYANWLSEDARKKNEPPKPIQAQSPDDAEIAEIRAKMPTPPVAQSVLDTSVEKTLVGIPDRPTDPYLEGRLRHIIASRFRDVRSAFELRQLLQRDSKVGGMGLEQAKADTVAGQIEAAYKQYHDPIMSDEKKKLEEQQETQKVKVEERRKREAEEHAKWYQERIVSRKNEEERKLKLAEQLKETMAQYATSPTATTLPIDVKEQKKETERFGEMVPAVAAGAVPVAVPVQKNLQATSVPAAQPAAMPAAGRVARPEVKVSMETVKLQNAQPALKPRMDDVTYGGGPRLMGLSQELKSLTLSEFRRLAKDPEDAIKKISQKIETLGQESFEKRLEGIQAWQASPLQELYVRLVSESFTKGKPVTEIAEEHRAAGVDSLRPEEVNAIIAFNSGLHY